MEDDKEITSYTIDGYKFSVNSGNKHTGYIVTVEDVSPSWTDDSCFESFQIPAVHPKELRKLSETFAKAAQAIEDYQLEHKAKHFHKSYQELIEKSGLVWLEPHTTKTEENEYFSKNKLSIYVNKDKIEYIKVWGINIFNEMEECLLDHHYQEGKDKMVELWNWLIS